MLALLFMLLAADAPQDPPATPGDPAPASTTGPAPAVQVAQDPTVATLQGCQMEEGRWVCRYQMPEIRLVEQSPQTVSTEGSGLGVAAEGPGLPADPGVLSEAESQLVRRCAEASWLSLCLPGDRRQARTLKAAADAYEAARREVGTMLGEGRCDAAVSAALSGGYLALAREVRSFCES